MKHHKWIGIRFLNGKLTQSPHWECKDCQTVISSTDIRDVPQSLARSLAKDGKLSLDCDEQIAITIMVS